MAHAIQSGRGTHLPNHTYRMAVGPCEPLSHDSKILIVGGGGTMGSSTALHLCRRGYRNVHIIDKYPIPSIAGAGSGDLNKIIGSTNTGSRADIAEEIMRGWRTDPVFSPYYHETGRVTAGDNLKEIALLRSEYEGRVKAGDSDKVEWLEMEEDLIRRAPNLNGGQIQGWKGIWESDSGWAEARYAIESVGRELKRRQVKMTFGPSGTFATPILDPDTGRCIGVQTDSAQDPDHKDVEGEGHHLADRVVLCTGAWTPGLVDLAGQCVSKCWLIAHLPLTPSEASRYRSIPVVYNESIGFCFEPIEKIDPITGEKSWVIKLSNEFAGATRWTKVEAFSTVGAGEGRAEKEGPEARKKEIWTSVPRSHADHPDDTVPQEYISALDRVVECLLPEFVGRPYSLTQMCWCTDTEDAEWLFCQYPDVPGLYVCSGDSGHSFVTLPAVGGQIADLLEGKVSATRMAQWAWRPGKGDPNGTGRGGPEPEDLSKLHGWAGKDAEGEI